MGQVSTGIRRVLEVPFVYRFFQRTISRKEIWPDLIAEFFPSNLEDLKVLDIGCGPGTFLEGGWLNMKQSNFVGIDPSPQYIQQASRNFPDARFLVGTVREVQLEGRAFDVAVLSGVLHHVDDFEAKAIIDFAADHLAPSGLVISVDPVLFPGQNAFARWMALADRGQNVRTVDELRALWDSCEGLFHSKIGMKQGYLRVPYNHAVCIGYKSNIDGRAEGSGESWS